MWAYPWVLECSLGEILIKQQTPLAMSVTTVSAITHWYDLTGTSVVLIIYSGWATFKLRFL